MSTHVPFIAPSNYKLASTGKVSHGPGSPILRSSQQATEEPSHTHDFSENFNYLDSRIAFSIETEKESYTTEVVVRDIHWTGKGICHLYCERVSFTGEIYIISNYKCGIGKGKVQVWTKDPEAEAILSTVRQIPIATPLDNECFRVALTEEVQVIALDRVLGFLGYELSHPPVFGEQLIGEPTLARNPDNGYLFWFTREGRHMSPIHVVGPFEEDCLTIKKGTPLWVTKLP